MGNRSKFSAWNPVPNPRPVAFRERRLVAPAQGTPPATPPLHAPFPSALGKSAQSAVEQPAACGGGNAKPALGGTGRTEVTGCRAGQADWLVMRVKSEGKTN